MKLVSTSLDPTLAHLLLWGLGVTSRNSKITMASKTRWALLVVAFGGAALGSAMSASSCVSQPTSLNAGGDGGTGGTGGSTGGSGGSTGGEGGEAPSTGNKGASLFAALEDEFYQSCAPACHEAGGVADMPFLAGPDHYQSVISWPGIVVKDPKESKLLTIPVAGQQHPYKKLDSAPLDTTLFPKIKAWLAEEAKGIVTTGQPTEGKLIEPFVPIIGFNAIYLSPLGAEFTGMAVTFTAYLIDDYSIELSDIQVHPTASSGVHMLHPLFVVNPVGKPADPDPVDSFSNVEQTFDAGKAGTLGPGTLILSNWLPDAKLSVAFQEIDIVTEMMMDDAGTGTNTGGCKDVASFNSNAKGPLKQNCTSCHGGGNAQAKGAIDMSKIDSDPEAACAQVKNRVDPGNPSQSQLFITTDPDGNAAHPYKFGGSNNNWMAFVNSVTKWVQAEK